MPQRLLAKPTATVVGEAKGERREEEGFGDSEQDVVGSAGMLPEPIRLQSIMVCKWSHDFCVKHIKECCSMKVFVSLPMGSRKSC